VLGLASSYAMCGFIHILLVVAIIILLVRVIQVRKVLYRDVHGRSNRGIIVMKNVRIGIRALALLALISVFGACATMCEVPGTTSTTRAARPG